MLVFLSARLRAFVFFAVVLPVVGIVVRRVARTVEGRTGGSSRVTRTLDRVADFTRRGR
jgi:hypothetical protein